MTLKEIEEDNIGKEKKQRYDQNNNTESETQTRKEEIMKIQVDPNKPIDKIESEGKRDKYKY
jgi:hypothetical protein